MCNVHDMLDEVAVYIYKSIVQISVNLKCRTAGCRP